jgi:hypothetical protein
MKIRNGFVSNSSSSSFIIDTGKEVKSKEDIQHLFKDLEYEDYEGKQKLSKEEIANFVFYRMKPIKEASSWLLEELVNSEETKQEIEAKTKEIYLEKFPEHKRIWELSDKTDAIYSELDELMNDYWTADNVTNTTWNEVRAKNVYPKYPWIKELDDLPEEFFECWEKELNKIRAELYEPLINELFKNPIYTCYIQGNGEGFDTKESGALYENNSSKWSTEKLKFYS